MSYMLRLVSEKNKEDKIFEACQLFRDGDEKSFYVVDADSFSKLPGAPFAYWISDKLKDVFGRHEEFESEGRTVKQGVATADDFRFVRCHWEVDSGSAKWPTFSKGGKFGRFYSKLELVVNWKKDGEELASYTGSAVRNPSFYFREGLTWPLRATAFSPQVLPKGVVFSTRGSAIFSEDPLFHLGLFSSYAVDLMLRVMSGVTGQPQYDMGDISLLPVPDVPSSVKEKLKELALRGWGLNRKADSVSETSLAFVLPEELAVRILGYDRREIFDCVNDIQDQIDDIVFELYGFSEEDRKTALQVKSRAQPVAEESGWDDATLVDGLLSWCTGVIFGRYDWRLATGEREVCSDPGPFDLLPPKSPGMLSDEDEPFHVHSGVLVDDIGHKHDLPRLIENMLQVIDVDVEKDVRQWVRAAFFNFHLDQYSKSRRKAPIYWPLATASGSYTLWLYYPDLTDQTLFTAVNDFVEPKLKQVESELGNLRLAGTGRSRADEKRLEELSDFRNELADLRDTLLKIAPGYKPNHDDGVQITAAPLWPLFRHKPWQKVLKETWEKLEQGDYDWAHLAMAYWPERVREKCVTDKSLAIAHDLEHLYVEPEPAPKKARGRKKNTGSSE